MKLQGVQKACQFLGHTVYTPRTHSDKIAGVAHSLRQNLRELTNSTSQIRTYSFQHK